MNLRKHSILAACLVLASCTTPPAEYHHFAAHPYEVQERIVVLDLSGHDPATAAAMTGQFAAARPNNGSSFTIAADIANAQRLKSSLIAQGVSSRDIGIVSTTQGPRVERRDRIATAAGCYGGPRSVLGLGTLDDGYDHSNADSALLGCAVRRNIAAMTDDPRTLTASDPAGPRDGVRAASVYEAWTKGDSTASKVILPTSGNAKTDAYTPPK